MSFYTPEQLEIFNSTRVRCGILVEIMFEPAELFWNGDHSLEIGGKLYRGAGVLGRIEGGVDVRTTESSQLRLVLTGTNAELNAIAVQNAASQEGRFCFISAQPFDAEWRTVGPPVRIFTGLTQPLVASRQSSEEGQGVMRSLTLPVENFFYGRSRPPFSLYTATDQRGRYPGDAFLDHQSQVLRGVSYAWP